MFTKKANFDGFFDELKANLDKQDTRPKEEKQAKAKRALENVAAAADLLDDVGLEKQAAFVTKVLQKLAWYVPTSDTAGLTPEKMESNLKEKGWVFNDAGAASKAKAPAADAGSADVGDVQSSTPAPTAPTEDDVTIEPDAVPAETQEVDEEKDEAIQANASDDYSTIKGIHKKVRQTNTEAIKNLTNKTKEETAKIQEENAKMEAGNTKIKKEIEQLEKSKCDMNDDEDGSIAIKNMQRKITDTHNKAVKEDTKRIKEEMARDRAETDKIKEQNAKDIEDFKAGRWRPRNNGNNS